MITELQSFGDESGERDLTLVSFIIADAGQWERFAQEWQRRVLQPNGVNVFHMHRFMSGAYSGDRNQTIEAIHEIIRDSTWLRLIVGLETSVHRSHKADVIRKHHKAYVPSAYSLCILRGLQLVSSLVPDQDIFVEGRHGSLDLSIAYVFESGHRNWREATIMLGEVQQQERLRRQLRMQTFALARKEDFIQLQAADAVAYAVNAATANRHKRLRPIVEDVHQTVKITKARLDAGREFIDKAFRRYYLELEKERGERFRGRG